MSRLMEKLATRAWKKNIDVIDRHPEYRKRLEDAGVIDYKREVDGLEKGSDAIVGRHGFRVEQLQPTKEEPRPEGARSSYLFQQKGIDIDDKDVKKHIDTVGSRAEDAYGFLFDPAHNVVFRGDVARKPSESVIRGAEKEEQLRMPSKQLRAALAQHVEALKNSGYRNAANAIMFRHEIDEGRDKGNAPAGWEQKGHYSPRVIERESVNIAGMPPLLRKHMKQLRDSSPRSEGVFMSTMRPNFEYGESGKDKKKFR